MSKAKSGEQPHYELLYLISNKFSEDEVKPIMEKVNALVTANGGEISLSEELAKNDWFIQLKVFVLAITI